jgi:hypothetical protein
MDKVIGFFLAGSGAAARFPPWIDSYPWLNKKTLRVGAWSLAIWGHGQLNKFARGDGRVVAGYSDTDLETLTVDPLENRGVVLDFSNGLTVRNDALGMMPVVYTFNDGVPIVSTCEPAVLEALGDVALDEGGLAAYFLYQCAVGRWTVWEGVHKLYANSVLRFRDGELHQEPQTPLNIRSITNDGAADVAMEGWSRSTIRRYTDPLGEMVLPLSSGQDSRLILGFLNRPERVKVRSYPSSSPAQNSWEVAIPKESARLFGVEDHGILDFFPDYTRWTPRAIPYYSTLLSAVQAYLFAASELIGQENQGLPVISGAMGDVLAGMGVEFIERNLAAGCSGYDLYRMGCYCHDKEWKPADLDSCLTFDWREALEEVKPDGLAIWEATEGNDLQKATLIRLRDRGAQTITYAWAALDIWGSIVTPYLDRSYVETMLSMPPEVLRKRAGQVRLFERCFPEMWPHAGLDLSALNCTNAMNSSAIRHGGISSLWPLPADGQISPLFRADGVSAMIDKALAGDQATWFKLNSLQSIAWAGENYVS